MDPTALPLELLKPSPEGRSRMASAVLISLALHLGLLVFKWHSSAPATTALSHLQISLVNSKSVQAPLKPQLLAQHDLDGGGEHASGLASSPLPLTQNEPADDAMLAALRLRQTELEALQEQLLAKLQAAATQVPQARRPNQESGYSVAAGQDDFEQESLLLSARIAAIKEQIDSYNARPRHSFVGPSAKGVEYASYVEDWRERIELIGTEHYPPEARGRIYGDLQVTVFIGRDGQIVDISFDRPSPHTLLNVAARRIIELAAPFAPLPAAITKDTDVLAITRTWHFTNTGLGTE